VGGFQYNVSDRLMAYAYRMIPVEITGVATDEILVSSIITLRGLRQTISGVGELRGVKDGIVGRGKRVLKIVRSLGISGRDWI
jgi:DNA polymerase II large subunit